MIKQIVKKLNKDGTYSDIEVDWEKMPCFKCIYRYHFVCPQCEWNNDGHVIVY